jgi:hypothetical protein
MGRCTGDAMRGMLSFADGGPGPEMKSDDASDSERALKLARAYALCPTLPSASLRSRAPGASAAPDSCRAYFKRMLAEVVAEYGAFVAQGRPGPLATKVTEFEKNKYTTSSPGCDDVLEQFNCSLVVLDGAVWLATYNREEGFIWLHGGSSIRVSDGCRRADASGVMREVGYVGSYVNDMAALMLQARSCCSDLGRGLRTMVRVPVSAELAPAPAALCASVPASAAQTRAVRGVGHAYELVHGPPGTGKSTTIFHVVHARAKRDAVSIVTAMQNKAIDALAEKFAQTFAEMPFVVDGNPARLGPVAARFTLTAQVERHPRVLAALAEADRLLRIGDRLRANANAALARCRQAEACKRLGAARRQERARAAYEAARLDADRVANAHAAALESQELARDEARDELHDNMRVYICTIDLLSGNILRGRCAWLRPTGMIVVDEAGCVPEYKIAALTLTAAHNIVAVGDDKQLPPFTRLEDPQQSFYVRAKECDVPEHALTEQFRMHPRICSLVSRLFYSDTLTTHAATSAARRSPRPLVWINSGDRTEEKDGNSYRNGAEASLAVDAATRAPEGSVAILTFYSAQARLVCKLLDERKLPYNTDPARLRVGTVDAAQGSEADTVIVSCVRANGSGNVGFTANANRMCVALSRAREQMVIVGNAKTLRGNWRWGCVYKECTVAAAPRDAFAARAAGPTRAASEAAQ